MDTIREWGDEIHNSTEFVDAIRRELLGKRVFVFLRDGKILNLLRGATVIDAAFAIHTEVGLHMTECQINGLSMPLSYQLQNGDVVSIISNDKGRPSLDWMRFARSRSTRARLRLYFRGQQRAAYVQKGWLIIDDFIDMHLPLVLQRYGVAPSHEQLCSIMQECHQDPDDVCVSLAKTKTQAIVRATLAQLLSLRFDLVELAFQTMQVARKRSAASEEDRSQSHGNSDAASAVTGNGSISQGSPTSHTVGPDSTCSQCMPVPGDAVVGVIDDATRDITVHAVSCPEFRQQLMEPGDAAKVVWSPQETYFVVLQVFCIDRKFLLRDVSDVVAEYTNIVQTSSITIGDNIGSDKAMLQYKVSVSDLAQLNALIEAIYSIPEVVSCERLGNRGGKA